MDEEKKLYEHYLKTTSKQAGMVFGVRIIGYLMGFAMQAIFARLLGPDKYGLYSLGLTIATAGVLFGTFGLGTGTTRFLGEYIVKGDFPNAKGTILTSLKLTTLFSVISAVAILIFRDAIALGIFKDARLSPLLPWFSIVLVLLSLDGVLRGIFGGLKKPSIFTFYKEVVERGLRLGLFIVLFTMGLEVLGAVISTIISSTFVVVRLLFWLNRNAANILDKNIKPSRVARPLLSYSSNALFISFTSFLMGQVNRLIIGGFMDSASVGLYSVSDTIAHLSTFFLMAFNSIFAVIISELYHKDNVKMLSDMYSNITRWITSLTLPLIIWIITFSEDLLLMFGSEYIFAKWALIVLAVSQFVNALSGSCGLMLTMTKYQRLQMINGILIASINIGLNYALIPIMGILGSALASALSIALVNSVKLVEVLIVLKMFPYKRSFAKLIVPSLGTLAIVSWLSSLSKGPFSAIVGLLAAFIVFFGLLSVMKLEPEDKLILRVIKTKLRR